MNMKQYQTGMAPGTIIHSVFETRDNRRECVGAWDNNVEAQACIDRRTLRYSEATYDIQLFKLGEESGS